MLIDPNLVVSFDAQAIREHFQDYPADSERAQFVAQADDETLTSIGREAILDEALWEAFDNALERSVSYAIALEAERAERPVHDRF